MGDERIDLAFMNNAPTNAQYICPFCNNQNTRKGSALQLSLLIAPTLLLLIVLFSIT